MVDENACKRFVEHQEFLAMKAQKEASERNTLPNIDWNSEDHVSSLTAHKLRLYLKQYCIVCIVMCVPQRLLWENPIKVSQTHKTNLEIANARESEIPLSIRKIQEEIEKKYPRVFLPRKKSVMCPIIDTELLLSHKAPINNVHQHANSASHGQKASKSGAQGSKDISSFFTSNLRLLGILDDFCHLIRIFMQNVI